MKIAHNSDHYRQEKKHNVKCSKYHKDATLTVFYRCKKLCKTDIQLTPIESGMNCSLWEEKKSACIECPHKPKA